MSVSASANETTPATTLTPTWTERLSNFPWWLLLIALFLVWMGGRIWQEDNYRTAFNYMLVGHRNGWSGLRETGITFGQYLLRGQGIILTLRITLVAFVLSMILGLTAGLGRISRNVISRNIAITYIEVVRGIPVLVMVLVLGFSVIPDVGQLLGLPRDGIRMEVRGMIILAIVYGAFVAEIFRAGIESVPRGQMEAARSMGMSYPQAMTYIILPQAIRNILPALGNDFIAILKDSSLLSALAVSEITQLSRLYVGSTFRFRESYLVLAFLYLMLTITLSLLQRWYAQRMGLTQGR
jgi:polar amino acid transport system permease protein